jgi:hypothetical protein
LLLVVIGVGNTWAAYLHAVRSDLAALASFLGGGALSVWMAMEMIMLRSVQPLQVAYLLLGAVLVVTSTMQQVRRMMPPWGGARPARPPGSAVRG